MLRRNETAFQAKATNAVNILLAAIPRDEAAPLLDHAERFSLTSGEWASDSGRVPMLWLPETAVLSFGEEMGGRFVECGIVGREGVVGWEPLTGLAPTRHPVGVLVGGTALAVPADRVAPVCDGRPRLAATLLRYRETLVSQLRSTVAARLQLRPDGRLARWLCMLHDRVEGDTLDITHLRLAAFLNARRASITDCLHLLEGERVIRCTRGKIFVRDRAALEAAAGAGYGQAEAVHRSLIGPFGKGRC
ncbi:Crp/Fnr family transcriptional regulator [Sphingomonas sp.]|uniref:Crp/Fnr family transcriptional regulator n=1 Tax=Sphingomonas sp. TaxID=28214 RepID=UPI002BD5AB9E|nr:Crp/Fnr family transcriptional regulator [Sphingomonas sp.]HTG38305.1 Crp/Fnr family transcriptional regulator [Sphingomonas sp.]